MILLEYSGARGTLIHEKKLKSKISCQTLFNQLSRVTYTSGISDVSLVELHYSTDLSKNALNVTLYSKFEIL